MHAKGLADVLNRVAYAKDRVRITRRGKAVAAVVPIEDLELIERLEDEIDIREAEGTPRSEEEGNDPSEENPQRVRAVIRDVLRSRVLSSRSASAQEARLPDPKTHLSSDRTARKTTAPEIGEEAPGSQRAAVSRS